MPFRFSNSPRALKKGIIPQSRLFLCLSIPLISSSFFHFPFISYAFMSNHRLHLSLPSISNNAIFFCPCSFLLRSFSNSPKRKGANPFPDEPNPSKAAMWSVNSCWWSFPSPNIIFVSPSPNTPSCCHCHQFPRCSCHFSRDHQFSSPSGVPFYATN